MRLKEIALIVKGEHYGKDMEIKEILPPEEAKNHCLTFLFTPDMKTRAGAVIAEKRIPQKSGIVVKDCKKAMFYLLAQISKIKREPAISKQAIIEDKTKIHPTCTIEPYAIIKKGAEIGKNTYIGANVYIDGDTKIGKYCSIDHHTVIYKNCRIGNFVQIGANCAIGKQGFGYIKFKNYKRLPHIGGLIIGDYVELGANVAIDCATIGNTVIGNGTKIDNLVHIGHNVYIGRNCLIMGQAGIAGSTKIGNNVILCGQTGVSDHLTIGNNAVVYAKSGVFSNLESNKKYSGIPAREHQIVLRALARLYKDL